MLGSAWHHNHKIIICSLYNKLSVAGLTSVTEHEWAFEFANNCPLITVKMLIKTLLKERLTISSLGSWYARHPVFELNPWSLLDHDLNSLSCDGHVQFVVQMSRRLGKVGFRLILQALWGICRFIDWVPLSFTLDIACSYYDRLIRM